MLNQNKNKTDLLKFQKSLNDQFMTIFEDKSSAYSQEGFVDTLGLSVSHKEMVLFLPFNDLHTIAAHLRYESSIKTKSWILGFNHEHGNLYTVFNLNKALELIVNNSSDFESFTANVNSNIIYLKEEENSYNALLVDEFKLDYTAEFTLIIDSIVDKENDSFNFTIPEGIDLSFFLNKDNMSSVEWGICEHFKKLIQDNTKFNTNIPPQIDGTLNPLSYIISKVYLDSYGQRPIFVINATLLMKLLSSISPF